MSNGPLTEDLPMNSELSPRVSALEVGVRTLSNEMESVKVSVDRVSSNVIAGFAEIRRDFSNSGRTNWGWVIAGIAVIVALVGAVGTAWVRPLQQVDENFSTRIRELEARERETRETATRTDERLKVYRELGVLPKDVPTTSGVGQSR